MRSEAETPLSGAKHSGIVAEPGDWIWETNDILELVFVSSKFTDFTGLPADALLGKTLAQVVLSDDTAGIEYDVLFNPLDDPAPFHEIAFSLLGGDGEIRHFTLNGQPFFDDKEFFRGFRGTAHALKHT